VANDQRAHWESYSAANYQAWVRQGHLFHYGDLSNLDPNTTLFHPFISMPTAAGFVPDVTKDEYFVAWTNSPPPMNYGMINWDVTGVPDYQTAIQATLALRNETIVTRVRPYAVAIGTDLTVAEHAAFHHNASNALDYPHSFFFYPVHTQVQNSLSDIVAVIGGGVAWDASLNNLIPQDVVGLMVEIYNNCNQSYQFEIDGPDANYLGEELNMENHFAGMELIVDLALHTNPAFLTTPGHCQFSMRIFPGKKFAAMFDSKTPMIFAIVVASTFAMVAIGFLVYDIFVHQRNEKLVAIVARSNAIVTSLFPGKYRDEIIGVNDHETKNQKGGKRLTEVGEKALREADGSPGSRPMADLFLNTTVMFADVVGFTAWSSVREPTQVFSLLETIYTSFDEIAKQRRVFKVETVGDCYVAVAGVPDPRQDHAVVMARFARDIMAKMREKVQELEVTHGPDTGDLTLRIGIHSGPVTAGVLRGERSRFQLFGDTMNTTARIESTGVRGKIHVSQETADLLVAAGKGPWLIKREDKVFAKGKGQLETFWLSTKIRKETETTSSSGDHSTTGRNDEDMELSQVAVKNQRNTRLIEWNVETLLSLLKQIVARRNVQSKQGKMSSLVEENLDGKSTSYLEEVKEIITLPEFDDDMERLQEDAYKIVLPEAVVSQLHDFVTCIANVYRDNPFHNFEHASHVLMSVVKLMSRIVAPDVLTSSEKTTETAATLHDHTYGITSDPLTQFACAFSALIHDVDHMGVPNAQLVKECAPIAKVYNNRSVAEQNSLDLAWDLLMDSQFADLRATIYSTQDELKRFRQLVVNSVMAADIVDKDLKALRNARWERAFKVVESSLTCTNTRDEVNRKATIVIEHLIQASDVSHTMQHWHIYRKWNERFFFECYEAYLAGRADQDPSEGWYQGEIGFFDFYIIPLAKKLKDCGVFGKSSDEYLNYAVQNRKEWEARGKEVVAEMTSKVANKRSERQSRNLKESRLEL